MFWVILVHGSYPCCREGPQVNSMGGLSASRALQPMYAPYICCLTHESVHMALCPQEITACHTCRRGTSPANLRVDQLLNRADLSLAGYR